MAGLIDTNTGLAFGTGLQFQAPIGGPGLQISPSSVAALLLANETNGLATGFTDLSMVIKDTTTPANAFSGNPNTKWTYASPSIKWILGANGLYASGTTIRTEYDTSGVALGTRWEEGRTNRVIQNRDLTQAAWTKTSCTAAKTATGIDGVSNSASTLTATGSNATCLQSITNGSAQRVPTTFVRRRTGSGTVEFTMDNGSTWTVISPTTSWARFELAAATLANPTIGFRIVTSGDEIDVDFVQEESGAYSTSPIATTTTAVTRGADNLSVAGTLFPLATTAGTLAFKGRLLSTAVSGSYGPSVRASSSDIAAIRMAAMFVTSGGVTQANFSLGTASTNFDRRALAYATNDFAACFNGGAVSTDVSGSVPASLTELASYNNLVNSSFTGHVQWIFYTQRRMTNAELQALTAS